MNFLFHLFLFIFGLIVGSFLNCVIYRLERGESFLKGRSYCPHCKHILSWQDLIPIFSFLILKGKCRYCQQKISLQYPLVELATALVIFFTFFNWNWTWINIWTGVYLLIIVCFLILIFVFDLKHYLIPDPLIFLPIFFTLIYQFFKIYNFGNWNFSHLLNLALAILPAFFFLVLILISKEKWMGFGDFKLAIFLGLFLEFPKILVSLFLSFLIGATIGLGLIFAKKKSLKSEIPFAPFLVFGSFLTLFWGQKLIDFYLKLFMLK
jgi:leader peptidase (prepilin peptidase)/N-methyltransferase